MDATLKKMLTLLQPSAPANVRLSAVTVLAELSPGDAKVNGAILSALDDPDPAVRLRAIQAAGRLKIQDALPTLLSRVEAGGEESSESAHAAAKLGARAAKALQEMMPKIAPGLRRYIAAALGSAGTASADAAAIEFLLDKDPGVVASAVRSLIAQVPTLSSAKKQSLADQLLHVLKDAKTGLAVESEAAAVRLLAALGDKRAVPIFWGRCDRTHPAEIRVAALQALGGLTDKPNGEQLTRLIACASEERDFRIVAPALLMLQHLSATAKTVPLWLGMLHATDPAARRLALDKLADVDQPVVAEHLIRLINHPDTIFQSSVREKLSTMASGKTAMMSALFEASNSDAAWHLARALAPTANSLPPASLDRLFAQACQLLDGGDRRAEAFVYLLREADAGALRDRLEEKALALRKKKDYDRAVIYLKLLARDPAIGFAIRFELAACGLKRSSKELSHDARANDPCLGPFTHLAQGYEADLLKSLDKAKWLDDDDLYYLGFHFIERDGALRKFGGTVLQMLLKRSPKSKLAKDAKAKLKASGL